MDHGAHPPLIFGDEFCFPVTAAYYPTLYDPTGINVPPEFYEHQKVLGYDYRILHCSGHLEEGTSCMYYVVPDYGFTCSPHGPQPLHPWAVADGGFIGSQEYQVDSEEHTYHQPVPPTSHYPALPYVAERTPALSSHSLAYTYGLLVPGRLVQTVAVASERAVPWNSTQQQTTISSMKFQDAPLVPKVQPRRSAPWKQQVASGAIVPAKLSHARLASKQSVQVAVLSVKLSPRTKLSYNNQVSYVRSDLGKMVSAKRSRPSSNCSSHANRKMCFVNQHNIYKAKRAVGSLPSEIVVKSYTSRLHIGNPEGKIIVRTDQYNRDDFQVVYPNAKFFVIKSFDEADVHKSIKYGVWSSTSAGNKKLDSTFREAQVIAASSSTMCPVFLFFSVNGSTRFCGVAEMVGPVDFEKDMDFWSKDRWIGSFPVRWHIIKNVHNSKFRNIWLQNNENKSVTVSRDTQEIHYTPGTTMLKIFKYAKSYKCLLHEFMMHEEEEARSRQYMRFKMRRCAPRYIPASMRANVQQPKADSVWMDRIVRETHNLTGELQYLNLAGHQASWEESGNLTSKASRENAQKESHCHGKQDRGNFVKAATYQQYHAPTSHLKAAFDGEQQYWKKVEITPSGRMRPEVAASVLSKAPETHPNEGKNALVDCPSGTPELTCEEQMVGKPCSLGNNSHLSEACSKPLTGFVAIGSMLVPIMISNQ